MNDWDKIVSAGAEVWYTAKDKVEEWAEEIAQKSGTTTEDAKKVLNALADKLHEQGDEWKEKAKDWEPPMLKKYVRRDEVRKIIREELDAALKERA